MFLLRHIAAVLGLWAAAIVGGRHAESDKCSVAVDDLFSACLFMRLQRVTLRDRAGVGQVTSARPGLDNQLQQDR